MCTVLYFKMLFYQIVATPWERAQIKMLSLLWTINFLLVYQYSNSGMAQYKVIFNIIIK